MTSSTEVPQPLGSNPNVLNAQVRTGARPKTKNSPSGQNNSMRMAWIDPLPKVEVSMPLGLEGYPEVFPAGEIDLDFELPGKFSYPFCSLIESVGDRIQLVDEDKDKCARSLRSMTYFKSARQLYSTMLDVEKSRNQPLKAVYYDETHVPVHLGAALGILGHIDSKVGKVLIKDMSLLFKRWIARGLQIAPDNGYTNSISAEQLVWNDRDSLSAVQRDARIKIEELTDATFVARVGESDVTVSMPKLREQRLVDYYQQIHAGVPNSDALRDLVSLLQMTNDQWSGGTIGNGRDLDDALAALGYVLAPPEYSPSSMREAFEDFVTFYMHDVAWRIDSILKCGPPPAGSSGYGAQTVVSSDTRATWQFPLSDADVNLGFLFSPNKSFTLHPRMVGYSRRRMDDAAQNFAYQDGREFVRG